MGTEHSHGEDSQGLTEAGGPAGISSHQRPASLDALLKLSLREASNSHTDGPGIEGRRCKGLVLHQVSLMSVTRHRSTGADKGGAYVEGRTTHPFPLQTRQFMQMGGKLALDEKLIAPSSATQLLLVHSSGMRMVVSW